MKYYRRLTKEELEPLEQEFIEFLVVNGITADDWEDIRVNQPEKVEKMIDLFSEVIFEGIFRKARFLEIRTRQFVHAYQCLEGKIVLAGAETGDPAVDLSKHIADDKSSVVPDVRIFMTEKEYHKKREHELFDMTEKGCTISDGHLFKTLSLAYIESRHG